MTEPEPEYEVSAVTATCHTSGCANAETPIPLLIPAGGAVMCGVCGQAIEDVVVNDPRPVEETS